MTSKDNLETLFQTYTRDKIDEIVGEVRNKAVFNTESLRTLQAQSEENLKKAASLQIQVTESRGEIQALQNRLSENRTLTTNLLESAKRDFEEESVGLSKRMKVLESTPVPKSNADLPRVLNWDNPLYDYKSTDYRVSVYHITGPIYYVFVDITSEVFRSSSQTSASYVTIQIPQEIVDLQLYFPPQRLSVAPGNNSPSISSVNPGSNSFVVDEMGVKGVRSGTGGFYALSTAGGTLPTVPVDHL